MREARRRTRLRRILLYEIKFVCKQLIINQIRVEAAGVGIFRVIENRQLAEKSRRSNRSILRNWAVGCTWTCTRQLTDPSHSQLLHREAESDSSPLDLRRYFRVADNPGVMLRWLESK